MTSPNPIDEKPKEQEPQVDPIRERLLEFQEKLQELSKNENLVEFQLICYDKLTQKQYSKFRNIFLQKLPSDKSTSWKLKHQNTTTTFKNGLSDYNKEKLHLQWSEKK